MNEVTEVLFRDYATPAALADADPAAIEAIIRPTGFYRQKAKSIQSAARDLAALLPKREWTTFTNRVIHHGRVCCTAKRPHCESCPLAEECPEQAKGMRR